MNLNPIAEKRNCDLHTSAKDSINNSHQIGIAWNTFLKYNTSWLPKPCSTQPNFFLIALSVQALTTFTCNISHSWHPSFLVVQGFGTHYHLLHTLKIHYRPVDRYSRFVPLSWRLCSAGSQILTLWVENVLTQSGSGASLAYENRIVNRTMEKVGSRERRDNIPRFIISKKVPRNHLQVRFIFKACSFNAKCRIIFLVSIHHMMSLTAS